MPAITVEEISARRDPAPGWRWECQLPLDIPGSTASAGVLRTYCESADLTLQYLDAVPVFRRGSYVYYPKSLNIDPFDVQFYEDDLFTVFQYIRNWRLEVFDLQGNFGLPTNYERNVRFILYDLVGNVMAQFLYQNVWPMRYPTNYRLVGDTSERLLTSCQFSTNWGDMEFGGGNQPVAPSGG